MGIKSIDEFLVQYIEMEDGLEFRRCGPDCWERRYGESWEPEYYTDGLEFQYQRFIKLNGGMVRPEGAAGYVVPAGFIDPNSLNLEPGEVEVSFGDSVRPNPKPGGGKK